MLLEWQSILQSTNYSVKDTVEFTHKISFKFYNKTAQFNSQTSTLVDQAELGEAIAPSRL